METELNLAENVTDFRLLRKMIAGLFFIFLAFISAAVVQLQINVGD